MTEVHDIRPIPDPTLLTTQQLQREIMWLKEQLEQKMSAAAQMTAQRFEGIKTQFTERDTRFSLNTAAATASLALALEAAKEAVSKSEHAFIKQLEQLGMRLDDLKERFTRLEGTGAGAIGARSAGQAMGNYVMAIIGTILAATGLVLGLLLRR